jgi:hypothetical protein
MAKTAGYLYPPLGKTETVTSQIEKGSPRKKNAEKEETKSAP